MTDPIKNPPPIAAMLTTLAFAALVLAVWWGAR